MSRKSFLGLLILALLFSLGVWASDQAGGGKQLSEDLSYATYGNSAARVKVVVSSLVAKIEKPKQFLPLQIAIGLRGAGKEISFNYESFQLIDAEGNYAATATPEDLQKNQNVWLETERMRQLRPIQTADYYYGYKPVGSNMYPKAGQPQYIKLDQNMFLKDVIYFPLPDSLDGVMTLVVMGQGMDDPVEVNFAVPESKKEKEKEKEKDESK
jgi:hypothetical protein